MLEQKNNDTSEDRLMNLDELLSSSYDFVKKNPEKSLLSDYLAEISLLTSLDLWDDSVDRVNIMTSHSSKGLEFNAVFICGLEQSLFPLGRSMEDNDQLEEERRLFYVSITRCKKHLFLSSANLRRKWGKEVINKPSMFLEEIGYQDTSANRYSRSIDIEYEPDIPLLQLNMLVSHPKFGKGKIIDMRGSGKNAIVTILFQRYGIKKIAVAYTELDILEY